MPTKLQLANFSELGFSGWGVSSLMRVGDDDDYPPACQTRRSAASQLSQWTDKNHWFGRAVWTIQLNRRTSTSKPIDVPRRYGTIGRIVPHCITPGWRIKPSFA